MKDNILHDILRWQKMVEKIKKQARGQYAADVCPLNILDDHYYASKALFRTSQWEWTCEFCGTEFRE